MWRARWPIMIGGLAAAAMLAVAALSELLQREPGLSWAAGGAALLVISTALTMQLSLNSRSARLREAELIAGSEALRVASEQLEQLAGYPHFLGHRRKKFSDRLLGLEVHFDAFHLHTVRADQLL